MPFASSRLARQQPRNRGPILKVLYAQRVRLFQREEEPIRLAAQEADHDPIGRRVHYLLQVDLRGSWHSVSESHQPVLARLRGNAQEAQSELEVNLWWLRSRLTLPSSGHTTAGHDCSLRQGHRRRCVPLTSNVRAPSALRHMTFHLQPPPPREYSVRPSIRILGALLTGSFAVLQLFEAFRLFEHEGPIAAGCRPGRGQWVCEVGGWLLDVLPGAAHGSVLGLASLGLTGMLSLLTWWLLKPLVNSESTKT